ncbi:MAG TPA: AmmeMemoRadiSam system radical SAM enzyme [Caldilineae bacterium]|nr:AmmeMemoRadiSam system radical SAM enzyme [Caldilineae bacterium]
MAERLAQIPAIDLSSPTVREALLQERADGKIRCCTCERRCLLGEGGRGWCRTRVNHQGTLYTLIYGAVSSLSANPIEKKPLYHFYPGSRALTAGSWSCNFGCPWCQNWHISKTAPPTRDRYMTPEAFVQEALRRNCQGTSISFNEPTLSLEWSLDVFRLARARGLYNTYVTNGYMTAEALELLAEAGLDAMNVDIKGDAAAVWRYGKGIDVEKVWARCRQARELGIHLEITTLVIPGVNDDDECLMGIARRIAAELGPEVPWHVSGYYPAYHFRAPPTPVATLERAWAIGRDAGLQYVYVGNVPGHPYDNTYCPQCGELLVERRGFDLVRYAVTDGQCSRCGEVIAGVGWNWARD